MKKYFLIPFLALGLVYCKTKKTETTTATPVASAAKSPLDIAQKRWEGTTQADLDEGKAIYDGPCTRCHGPKKIVTRSEKEWLHEIDDMSPKSKLTADQKLKLTKYILSFREANTTTD